MYLPLSDDYVNDVVMPDRVSWDKRRVRTTPNGRQLLNMCKAGSVRILMVDMGVTKVLASIPSTQHQDQVQLTI